MPNHFRNDYLFNVQYELPKFFFQFKKNPVTLKQSWNILSDIYSLNIQEAVPQGSVCKYNPVFH